MILFSPLDAVASGTLAAVAYGLLAAVAYVS
jgi:hypothetical protein